MGTVHVFATNNDVDVRLFCGNWQIVNALPRQPIFIGNFANQMQLAAVVQTLQGEPALQLQTIQQRLTQLLTGLQAAGPCSIADPYANTAVGIEPLGLAGYFQWYIRANACSVQAWTSGSPYKYQWRYHEVLGCAIKQLRPGGSLAASWKSRQRPPNCDVQNFLFYDVRTIVKNAQLATDFLRFDYQKQVPKNAPIQLWFTPQHLVRYSVNQVQQPVPAHVLATCPLVACNRWDLTNIRNREQPRR